MSDNQIRIIGIGLDAANSMFVSSLLKLHANHRGTRWHYEDGKNAESEMDYMTICVDKEIVLVDADSETGRRALYTIRAVHGGALGVLTSTPDQFDGQATPISKPLRAQPLMAFFESVAATQLSSAAEPT